MLPSLNKVLTYLLTNKIQFTLAGKCFGLLRSYLSIPVADQGEGPRGLRHPPYFGERKKKNESQKEEKPAGQATKKGPPPPSLAQGLDLPLNAVALLHLQ